MSAQKCRVTVSTYVMAGNNIR